MAVLGACLMDRDLIVRLAPTLEPIDFYSVANGAIWRCMVDLFHQRVPIDLITIINQLRRTKSPEHPDGEAYLADLIAYTPTSVHAEYYAGIVREKSSRRRLIHASSDLATMAYADEMPLADMVARVEASLSSVTQRMARTELVSTADVASELYDMIGTGVDRPRILTGVRSLDRMTGGFTAGQLVVVAARPSYGKSAFALQIGYLAARAGRRVVIANAEMSNADTLMRLVSRWTGLSKTQVERGDLNDEQMAEVNEKLGRAAELPLFFVNAWHQSLPITVSALRSAHATKPFELVIVDYLGLFQVPGDKRAQQSRVHEVTLISRALKSLALELNAPVIALSQLNRAVEHRAGGRPMLSDLRESGSIEQDADIVIFIHRPGMVENADKSIDFGDAELIVAKHRGGPTGTAYATAVDARFAFQNRERVA